MSDFDKLPKYWQNAIDKHIFKKEVKKPCPRCGEDKEHEKDDVCMNCWQKYFNN